MVAGAGVADHLHLHVVPQVGRRHQLHACLGATKVLPELLEATYDRLKARIRDR